MTVNVLQALNNLDGTPLKEGDKPITLRDVITTALLATFPSDRQATAKQKRERYDLAKRIFTQDSPELDINEQRLIARLVGEAYSPLIVGQVSEVISE